LFEHKIRVPFQIQMPLSPTTIPRQRVHTREVRFEGFRRADGLHEIVARITDVKDEDSQLASGMRSGGDPVHDMSIRVAFDGEFTIVEVDTCSDWVPYFGGCDTIGPAYQKLVGLSLLQGFRNAVRERLGGVLGCTHITELLSGLPTAAIQMRAGEVDETMGVNGNQPFQLDRCHALTTTGETVRRYYRALVSKQKSTGRERMKIHEYQARKSFATTACRRRAAFPCFSVDEAVKAAEQLGGPVWVVKAQIHAGGAARAAASKSRSRSTSAQATRARSSGMQLDTHQTGPRAKGPAGAGSRRRRTSRPGALSRHGARSRDAEGHADGVVRRAGWTSEHVAATPRQDPRWRSTPESRHRCDGDAISRKIRHPPESAWWPKGRAVEQGLLQGVLGDRRVAGRNQSR
jgi:hypothetical protein